MQPSRRIPQRAKARSSAPGAGAAKSVPEDAGTSHVLVVEDERDLQELLRYNLEQHGFRVTTVASGEEALVVARGGQPDLILLDLMLPGMDGLSVCRSLREQAPSRRIPIVMLTAKSEEIDIVLGLELGADDYVTKPFSPRVLIARLKAVLRRRAASADEVEDGTIRYQGLVIDSNQHQAMAQGHPIDLTLTEFKLLLLLVRRPGRVYTRQQIIHIIHGPDVVVTDRCVDVQVMSLRRKLGAVDMGASLLTVRGVGYKMKEPGVDRAEE